MQFLPDTSNLDLLSLWQLRHRGMINDLRRKYIELVVQWRYPLQSQIKDRFLYLESLGLDLPDVESFLIFEISIKRSDRKSREAILECEILEALLLEKHTVASHLFYLQKGLNYFSINDFEKAFVAFIQVPWSPSSIVECESSNFNRQNQLMSRFNMILCLEALGHDYGDYFSDFEKALAQSSQELKNLLSESIASLELRDIFFRRDFASISDFKKTLNEFRQKIIFSDETQSLYFLELIEKLPFVGANQKSHLAIQKLWQRSPGHWLNAFRLRTLSETLNVEDLSCEPRLDAQIDRLYSWTWAWLQEPSAERLLRIQATVSQLLKYPTGTYITGYDHDLLKNSLMWLELFNSNSKYFGGDLRYHFSCGAQKSLGLVAEESLFLNQCIHQCSFENLKFFKLLPENLQKSLEARFPKSTTKLKSGFVVDYIRDHVQFVKNGKILVELEGRSFAMFFYLISKNPRLSQDIAYKKCFSARHFNPDVHKQMLVNFIYKLNQAFKQKFLKLRGSDILSTSSDDIWVKGVSPHILCFDDHWKEPHTNLPRQENMANVGTWLKREQISLHYKIPKTSLVRKINVAIKRGLIERKGIGKATRYNIKNPEALHEII